MEATTPPRRKRKLKWTEFIQGWSKKEPHDTFIVCVYRGEVSSEALRILVTKGRTTLGVASLDWGSSYAGDVFELQWKDRTHAYAVMDFLLKEGLPLFTQTRMCVNVSPNDLNPGDMCTPEWLERVHVRHTRARVEEAIRTYAKSDAARAVDMSCSVYPFVYSHEAAWRTDEGRALVRWLMSLYRAREADSSDEECFASGDDEQASPPVLPPTAMVKADDDEDESMDVEDEDDVCMICLVNRPNTLVLPCMDRVVCHACSEGLKKTPDVHTCVKCRRPIESVLEDYKQ